MSNFIPPAPCPEPDPDDTQPVIIPPRPSRARRMMHLQAAFYQALKDERTAVHQMLHEMYLDGLIKPTSPNGVYFGWEITDAGRAWLHGSAS